MQALRKRFQEISEHDMVPLNLRASINVWSPALVFYISTGTLVHFQDELIGYASCRRLSKMKANIFQCLLDPTIFTTIVT